MGMILSVSGSEGVPAPAGSHIATFAGVKEIENNYGKGLQWQFVVANGPHKGGRASRTTQPTPSLKNVCGKVLSGLLGRSLQADEKLDIDQFTGKSYLIIVAATESGSTRVESICQPPV